MSTKNVLLKNNSNMRKPKSKIGAGRKLEFGTRINFKLSPTDKRKVQIIAKNLDMNMSDFIRHLLDKQIERYDLQIASLKNGIGL